MKQLFNKLFSFIKRKQRPDLNIEKQNESAIGEDKNMVECKAQISEYDIYSVLDFLHLHGEICERHDFEVMRLTNITDTIDYLLRESLIEEVDEVYYRITECGRAKYDDLYFELTGNLR